MDWTSAAGTSVSIALAVLALAVGAAVPILAYRVVAKRRRRRGKRVHHQLDPMHAGSLLWLALIGIPAVVLVWSSLQLIDALDVDEEGPVWGILVFSAIGFGVTIGPCAWLLFLRLRYAKVILRESAAWRAHQDERYSRAPPPRRADLPALLLLWGVSFLAILASVLGGASGSVLQDAPLPPPDGLGAGLSVVVFSAVTLTLLATWDWRDHGPSGPWRLALRRKVPASLLVALGAGAFLAAALVGWRTGAMARAGWYGLLVIALIVFGGMFAAHKEVGFLEDEPEQ